MKKGGLVSIPVPSVNPRDRVAERTREAEEEVDRIELRKVVDGLRI